MEYTINELFDHLSEKVYTIRDTFIGFFGEDFVDLQEGNSILSFKKSLSSILEDRYNLKLRVDMVDHNAYYDISDADMSSLMRLVESYKWTIYVWWPSVTVTNENNRSVTIQDLFAKIEVGTNGRIPYENHGFLLNRATYTKNQFQSNYMHSHIAYIPKHDFTHFEPPCLGHGPIRETILTLKNDYDEALWMLFCQELSMYVTVESLAGGPYMRMEYIGSTSKSIIPLAFVSVGSYSAFTQSGFTYDELEEFIKYYLQHGHLSLIFKEGKFQCGLSPFDYMLDISNAFIDFYNELLSKGQSQLTQCFNEGLLMEVQAAQGKFYRNGNSNISTLSLDSYRGKLVLTFKGKEIRTTIIENNKDEETTLTNILNPSFVMNVLQYILRIINFRFQNGNNKSNDIASAYQRVCYI